MRMIHAGVMFALLGFACRPGIVDDPRSHLQPGNDDSPPGTYAPGDPGADPSKPGTDPNVGPTPGSNPGPNPGPSTPRPGPVCEPGDVHATDAPLRRLTPTEYANTVRDLFPGVTLPALDLVEEVSDSGFDNDAAHQAISPLHLERFRTNARAIAAAVVADQSWLPCDPAGEAACAAQIAAELGRRAYRRPLGSEENDRLVAFLENARSTFGFDDALRMFVEGMLESTSFLYRPELGRPEQIVGSGIALDDYEIASRLSYFLWETMPDAELFGAAERGELSTPAEVEDQARRLLADPRARTVVARFHRQWLRLDRLDGLTLARAQFPTFDDDVRDALAASTDRYLEYVFWEDGSFETLMTGREAFVNDDVAEAFGVPAPGSAELVPVTLDASERAGILTQPGLLASTSHPLTHSPIKRGVFVLDGILCSPPPAAPAGVDTTIPDAADTPDLHTTRERIEQTHGTEACLGCHRSIDGIGFTFENYDALGRFRTEENGYPVDATGTIMGTRDADGAVDGAVQLAELLADSRQVKACFAAHWFRFALGRHDDRDDQCQVEALADALDASGGSIETMLVALVTSPAFMTRPAL